MKFAFRRAFSALFALLLVSAHAVPVFAAGTNECFDWKKYSDPEKYQITVKYLYDDHVDEDPDLTVNANRDGTMSHKRERLTGNSLIAMPTYLVYTVSKAVSRGGTTEYEPILRQHVAVNAPEIPNSYISELTGPRTYQKYTTEGMSDDWRMKVTSSIQEEVEGVKSWDYCNFDYYNDVLVPNATSDWYIDAPTNNNSSARGSIGCADPLLELASHRPTDEHAEHPFDLDDYEAQEEERCKEEQTRYNNENELSELRYQVIRKDDRVIAGTITAYKGEDRVYVYEQIPSDEPGFGQGSQHRVNTDIELHVYVMPPELPPVPKPIVFEITGIILREHFEYARLYKDGQDVDEPNALGYYNEFKSLCDQYENTILRDFAMAKPTFQFGKIIDLSNGESVEPISSSVDRDAEDNPGSDEGTSIPAAIALGVLGVGAAAAAAGAAGGSSGKQGNEKSENQPPKYKLYFSKEFGSRLRKGGQARWVFCWIEEILPDGSHKRREDLTQQIRFRGGAYLQVRPAGIQSGCAAAEIWAVNGPETVREDVLSVIFQGEGGFFTERIHFKLVGEPYLEYFGFRNDNKIEILAGSGGSWQFTCRPQDFEEPPTLTAENTSSDFKVKMEPETNGDWLITVTDTGQKQENPQRLQIPETVSVRARYKGGVHNSYFTVIKSREGVSLNLNGSRPEIPGETREGEKEPPKIKVSFAVGVWNEANSCLDIHSPQELAVRTEYDQLVRDKIRIECLPDNSYPRDQEETYDLGADKPFAAMQNIPVKLIAEAREGGRQFRGEFAFQFLGDVEKAKAEYKQEYKMCVKITRDYIPDHLYERTIRELRNTRNIMGLYELREYRHRLWARAQHFNTLEREAYLKEAAEYEEIIARLQLTVSLTDWAFDAFVGMTVGGGTVAVWAVQQLKPALLNFWDVVVSAPPNSSIFDLLNEYSMRNLKSALGTIDGLVDFPQMPKPGSPSRDYAVYGARVMAFLTIYAVYRIVYRLYTDTDDDGNPVGLFDTVCTVLWNDILIGKLVMNFATGRLKARHDSDVAAAAKTGSKTGGNRVEGQGFWYDAGTETGEVLNTIDGVIDTTVETAKSGSQILKNPGKTVEAVKDTLQNRVDDLIGYVKEKFQL